MERVVLTVGYQGRTLESFIEELHRRGVKRVVDVRLTPFSRKKGFSKGPLKAALEREGIEYRHLAALGNPKELRGTEDFRAGYRAYVEANRAAFDRLLEIVLEKRSALLCFERSPLDCHRGVLADMLEEEGLSVQHI